MLEQPNQSQHLKSPKQQKVAILSERYQISATEKFEDRPMSPEIATNSNPMAIVQ
jgi:hypothetical protein